MVLTMPRGPVGFSIWGFGLIGSFFLRFDYFVKNIKSIKFGKQNFGYEKNQNFGWENN